MRTEVECFIMLLCRPIEQEFVLKLLQRMTSTAWKTTGMLTQTLEQRVTASYLMPLQHTGNAAYDQTAHADVHSSPHPEGCDLLLCLGGGLLKLGLGLLQLALQRQPCSLQAADLRLALLQGQGQLRHLSLDLQLLLFVLQTHLEGKRDVSCFTVVL